MEKESIKPKKKARPRVPNAKTSKPAVAKVPKPKKPPKEPKVRPAWTVAVKVYESKARNPKLRRGIIVHLRYRGKRVHTLTGATAEATMKEEAKTLNERKYTPDSPRVKLYCEMSENDRMKLAAKHSPELNFR